MWAARGICLIKCAVTTLLVGAVPSAAWEFTPGLPCKLNHDTAEAAVELTHDPGPPLYSIAIRKATPFRAADVFVIRFTGPAGLMISTDRHVLSLDGQTLTVTDRGFGNVLDGLQYNVTATAILGDEVLSFPLSGAAGAVEAFRRCRVAPGA